MSADLAVAFRTEEGREFLVVPTEDAVVTRHRPEGSKDWLKTKVDRTTTHRIIVGPVTVPVTEKDVAAFSQGGWSTTLGQKLVRALRSAEEHAPLGISHDEVRDHVDSQSDLVLAWRDNQESAKKESAKKESTQPSLTAQGYVHRNVVPGVTDFDMLDYAREHAENVLLSGPSGSGKELASTEPVLTPTGWVEIGRLKVGDKVIGSDGKATEVYGVFHQGVKPLWRLTFSDGASVLAGANHQWRVRDKRGRWSTRTTEDLLQYSESGLGDFVIPTVKAVEHPEAFLTIDPYMLGALLADGYLHGASVQWTKNSPEVADAMIKAAAKGGFAVREVTYATSTARQWKFSHGADQVHASVLNSALASLGLRVKSDEKFIPEQYMFASVEQRVALLNGLFDGDGSVRKWADRDSVTAYYTSSSERLVDDVLQLLWSLGVPASKSARMPGRPGKVTDTWRVSIRGGFDPFLASEHAGSVVPPAHALSDRHLRSIVREGDGEACCIAVTADDSLYVTKDYIVTHNTALPVEYARERGLESYCVAGNVALEPSQLFGKFVPEADGGFAWSEGPVTRLVRDGGVLVLDEINILSPKIATVLYPLLDFRREITLLDNDGEVIKAHKDLLVVATCNLGYQGTLPMSEALLDRFAHRHDWGYDAHAEEELVSSESLLGMARGIRADGDVRSPFSTRLLVAFEKFALSPLGWDYAVANLLGRFSDSEDRESVRALLDVRSDKIQIELGLKPLPDLEAAKAPGRPSSSEEWRKLLSMWA